MAKFKVGDVVIIKTEKELKRLKGIKVALNPFYFYDIECNDVVDDMMLRYLGQITYIEDIGYKSHTAMPIYYLAIDPGYNFYSRWIKPLDAKIAKVLYGRMSTK